MEKSPNSGGASSKQLVQVLVATAVAIIGVGAALIALLNGQVGRLQAKVDSKQAEVGSGEQVARRYQMTLASYDDTMSKIQDLETSVTQQAYVPTLLQQLQSLAQTTKLTVVSVRPSQIATPVAPPPAHPASSSGDSGGGSSSSGDSAPTAASPAKKKAPPAYDTMDVLLSVTGTYAQTATFLYDLTRFPKIIALSGIDMRPLGAVPGQDPRLSPKIQSTLHLAAFVFHDDAAPATIPGTGGPSSTKAATAPGAASSAVLQDAAAAAPLVGQGIAATNQTSPRSRIVSSLSAPFQEVSSTSRLKLMSSLLGRIRAGAPIQAGSSFPRRSL